MRWFVLALLAGCTEYNISSPPPAFGEPNPPSLDNPVNIDKIVQITTPAVDVLWVIDVSGSMREEQDELAANFPAFMDYFLGSGLDYHIGVISTDMDTNGHKGHLREAGGERWITPETGDAMGDFSTMARMGDRLSSYEYGLLATYVALEVETQAGGYNAGFLRDDDTAGLHVNIISDENDYSPDPQIGGGLEEFANWFDGLKPADDPNLTTDQNLTTFNSIVNPPGGGPLSAFPAGTRYMAVTDIAGGIKHDIHGGDWVEVLEQLGIQAAGLKSEYFLSHIPVVDTVAVRVELTDGTVLPFTKGQDYTYDASRNSVTFSEYIPDPLSSVFIEYTVLSSMVEVEEQE